MLNIERCPYVNTRTEKLLYILPALGVTAIWGIRMRKLIDNYEFWLTRQGGIDIKFLDDSAFILTLSTRKDFKTFQQF